MKAIVHIFYTHDISGSMVLDAVEDGLSRSYKRTVLSFSARSSMCRTQDSGSEMFPDQGSDAPENVPLLVVNASFDIACFQWGMYCTGSI